MALLEENIPRSITHNNPKLETTQMSIDKRINEQIVVNTIKKYRKKNKLLLHAMTWMNLRDTVVSGKEYRSPKNTNCRIPFMWSSRDCMTDLCQNTDGLGRGVNWDSYRKAFWGHGKFYIWIWVAISQMCKYICKNSLHCAPKICGPRCVSYKTACLWENTLSSK